MRFQSCRRRARWSAWALAFCAILSVGHEAAGAEPTEEALHPERRGIGAEFFPHPRATAALTPPLDPRKSLAVTDESILSPFSFEAVIEQLVSQAAVRGLSPLQLFQQWWDTQRAAPGLGLGPHCTDSGVSNMNGFPYACPRAEGNQATVDPFVNPATNSNAYVPVGLFNRFDLAPLQGTNCGEYRIVFAKRSGMTNSFERNLVIFEAVLPNPSPHLGLDGCRPVAHFWAKLSSITDVGARATALRNFYFSGLTGFMPVVHIDNYGNRPGNTGQVRTNQFMEFNWMLREFQLKKTCRPSCSLRFIPTTVKNNPGGTLFDTASTHPQADDFQSKGFSSHARSLAINDVNLFNMAIPDRFNSGESDAQEPPVSGANYTAWFGTSASTFRHNIQSNIPPQSGLTPDHIVARAKALSCAGCHQLSNGANLGGGIVWPASLSFVHVRESAPEPSPEGGSRFVLSPALTGTFLPHRKAVLENFLSASCGDGVCQSWEGATPNSCGLDCGCALGWLSCCGICAPPDNQCLDVECPITQ